MKKSACMIVCNGMPFIRPQMQHLYPLYDEIVIVEGADTWFSKVIGSTNSTDGTLEFIKSFPDPDKKIRLISKKEGWKNKDAMSIAYSRAVTGDIIFHIDVDEFIHPDVVKKCCDIIKNGKATVIPLSHNLMYKDRFLLMQDKRKGPHWYCPVRVLKRSDKYLIGHIPVGYLDPARNYKKLQRRMFHADKDKPLAIANAEAGLTLVHYSWSLWSQLEHKILYYSSRNRRPENETKRKLAKAKKLWEQNQYDANTNVGMTAGTPRYVVPYDGWNPCRDLIRSLNKEQ